MKIAYLFALKVQGGAETLMLDVFRKAQKSEFDLIGIYRHSGLMEDVFKDTKVPLFHIPFSKRKVHDIFCLRKLLKVNGIQIVHAQQPIDAFYALLACVGLPVKVVFTMHGYDFGGEGFWKKMLSFVLKHTDANIFVSKTQEEYFEKKYSLIKCKQHVLYNGISFDKFDNVNCHSIRAELGLSDNTFLLGSIGNFLPVRDNYLICRMLAELKLLSLPFHCLFVGKKVEGYEEIYDKCVVFCKENGLEDDVSFLGYRKDVPNLLNQMDVFVYASDHDTFGIAVVEAMAAGVPVVVNDWEVMNEITDNGNFATLYETGDIHDFASKIQYILNHKDVTKEKALSTKIAIRNNYGIDRHIRGLKNIYSEIIKS